MKEWLLILRNTTSLMSLAKVVGVGILIMIVMAKLSIIDDILAWSAIVVFTLVSSQVAWLAGRSETNSYLIISSPVGLKRYISIKQIIIAAPVVACAILVWGLNAVIGVGAYWLALGIQLMLIAVIVAVNTSFTAGKDLARESGLAVEKPTHLALIEVGLACSALFVLYVFPSSLL